MQTYKGIPANTLDLPFVHEFAVQRMHVQDVRTASHSDLLALTGTPQSGELPLAVAWRDRSGVQHCRYMQTTEASRLGVSGGMLALIVADVVIHARFIGYATPHEFALRVAAFERAGEIVLVELQPLPGVLQRPGRLTTKTYQLLADRARSLN